MKKKRVTPICMALCLALTMVSIPANIITVQAAEVIATVSGTVLKGTTSDLLILSTKDGKMEIKLDSDTDTSDCKLLLPDKKVSVSVSHGSDGYLHAVRLSNETATQSVSVDSSSTAVVSGTIGDKSTGEILYFNTPQGEMQIKLDSTTNMSGCKILVTGKTYSITCARGSDAYMHAVSISDSLSVTTSSSNASLGLTPAPAGTLNTTTMWVSGTVGKNTKENLLYLSTKDGVMEIVIDSNTDSRNGMVLAVDRTLLVSVYRGSDAYMHAASIVGGKDNVQPATVDTSSTSTVTGTVGSKSTENILYLSTSAGEMELKLSALETANNFKVLINGKKVSVTCARGSDAYMYALSITGIQ